MNQLLPTRSVLRRDFRKNPIRYQSFAQRIDNVGYDLSKGFKSLTKHDENDALALVEKLQKPGLRAFALVGILTGLDGLLTEQAILKQ